MRVQVNLVRCEEVAQRLLALVVPSPAEPWSSQADSVGYDLATLNLVLVAVCHQTQTLAGEIGDQPLRGWDYLQRRFQIWAGDDVRRIAPDQLATLSLGQLRDILRCADQLSTQDLENRAAIVRDCGVVLTRLGVHTLTELYQRSGRRIAGPENSLLTVLRAFRAFNDPVRKKALFLLGLNSATCGWQYEDPDSLDPPADYHEVRGHLRLGTIQLLDQGLLHAVSAGDFVGEPDDIAIREAVTQAIRHVARRSGFTPMQLHYAFWNLFRAVCVRQRPRCRGQLAERLPEDYRRMVEGGECCFVTCCDSVDKERAIDEHRFETDWY